MGKVYSIAFLVRMLSFLTCSMSVRCLPGTLLAGQQVKMWLLQESQQTSHHRALPEILVVRFLPRFHNKVGQQRHSFKQAFREQGSTIPGTSSLPASGQQTREERACGGPHPLLPCHITLCHFWLLTWEIEARSVPRRKSEKSVWATTCQSLPQGKDRHIKNTHKTTQ